MKRTWQSKPVHGARSLTVGLMSCCLWLPVWAQSSAPADWRCDVCEVERGWSGYLEAGLGYQSDDAFRFGDYTGLDEDGVFVSGAAAGSFHGDDGDYLRFEGLRLGLDSRALWVEGGRQGLYQLRASYQGIPRRIFDTTSTPYAGNGGDTLTLPNDWVRGPTTSLMPALDDSLEPVDVEWDWDIYTLGADYQPSTRWTLTADYRRTERDGQSKSAGSFLFSTTQFLDPVDYTTDELEASAVYVADTWQISFAYFGSTFDNGNEALTWDNAYAQVVPGDDRGRTALNPDNDAHQLSVAGSVLLPARTTLNGRLALGRMSQDEALLAYTVNPDIPTDALPAAVFDGEVDTTDLSLRAVSSPLKDFTIEGELRYNERDNDSPEATYDYVITDTLLSEKPATNIAYDYERRDLKINGTWRMNSRFRLQAGYDNERRERTRQDRNRTTTDRLWARLDTRWMGSADLDVEFFLEDRGGSTYATDPDAFAPQNPLMRKYNMADRERAGVRLFGNLYTWERIDLGLELEYSQDDYDRSDVGLTETTYLRYGLDASWLVTDQVSTYLALYREEFDSEQRGSQTFSEPDWEGNTDDTFSTATIGIRYPQIISRVDAFAEYTYADSDGEVQNNTSGLVSQFPDLDTTRHTLRIGLDYPWREDLTLSLQYLYEDYDSADWALEGINADSVSNLLSLGADPFDYDVSVFYLSGRWSF